jgi:hypothetical protein
VHAELWPAWVVARSPEDKRAAADALAQALAADPGLSAIAAALTSDPDGVAAQVDLWNAALEARHADWALGVTLSGAVGVKSYRVLARPVARIGGREVPVRVALRVDRLNIVEGWLGLAEDVGQPIVVADRVADFAFDVLWPDLDPGATDPLAPAVRSAAEQALGATVLAPLVATAPARGAMVRARQAVEERRARCGSDFVLRFGWSGPDRLGDLYRWAEAERSEDCPGLAPAEADALARGSLRIRRDPDLTDALEALVAWAARGVVVHEGRHGLDHEDWGVGTPPPSELVPLDGRARTEASAYVSALASSEGLVAWVQGCDVVRSGDGGSARVALQTIAQELGAS